MRRKRTDFDILASSLIEDSLRKYEEEMANNGITVEELAAVFMKILLAFMDAGFERDEAFTLLLNVMG